MLVRIFNFMILLASYLAESNAWADEVTDWNEVLIQAVRADRTPPPHASRAMAMVHTAIFDAVNALSGRYEPYLLTSSESAPTSDVAAVASAAAEVLIHLFPAQEPFIARRLNQTLRSIPNGPSKTSGIRLGQRAAQMIIQFRSDDRGTVPPSRIPASGPGIWEPTLPNYVAYLLPGWGAIKPWAMRFSSQFRRHGPPPLSSERYADSYNETKTLGEKYSRVRTVEQTEIARFWEDPVGTATPPGHWNVIARDIALRRGLSLVENGRLFALLNMALADAAIVAWDMKFTYYSWRPITAIRRGDEDSNPLTEADASWEPLLTTPPFPDYVSGHSTFSEAAGQIIALFFGSEQIAFSARSDALPGVVRSYQNIFRAVDEAGRSRVYGGIHFQFADHSGLMAGARMANHVFQTKLRPRR
ncbi:MAG: vanadium-dependent haloperoxidase [Oligoflexus sp.]